MFLRFKHTTVVTVNVAPPKFRPHVTLAQALTHVVLFAFADVPGLAWLGQQPSRAAETTAEGRPVRSATAATRTALIPCRIEIVEKGSGWPVPLVQLRTVHQVTFVTDNAGLIALDLPELMGRETWFEVIGHGYEIPQDGFGYQGVRMTPQPGGRQRVEVTRTMIAKRLGRATGAGIFGESQKLGEESSWTESGVFGCDSVQNAVYRGRLFWAWGDTLLPGYPLGLFDMSSATTEVRPMKSFEPPLRLRFDHFRDPNGRPRGVAPMPGAGPTWLSGYVSLPDAKNTPHLVATYMKVRPPMEAYERGLCVWNDQTEKFDRHRVLWTASVATPKEPAVPEGQPAFWKDEVGREWVLYGNPLPSLRCPAHFEAWTNPATWEVLSPQPELVSSAGGKPVKPHSGSIAWNEFRRRWVTVFVEAFGQPSGLGEVWYAEALSPVGPWGTAVKVLSHANYTFYNPRLHPEFTAPDSPLLIFEGTYTKDFADRPPPTPRYDYNQVVYRLDLDDPSLVNAHDGK